MFSQVIVHSFLPIRELSPKWMNMPNRASRYHFMLTSHVYAVHFS